MKSRELTWRDDNGLLVIYKREKLITRAGLHNGKQTCYLYVHNLNLVPRKLLLSRHLNWFFLSFSPEVYFSLSAGGTE